MADLLAASFAALITAETKDPSLPLARTAFVAAMAKGWRVVGFQPLQAALAAAAERCGAALAENLTREALYFVTETAATQPVVTARPLATLVLAAASEATLASGHGGFTDPGVGQQIALFLPAHAASLDPRVVLDVIRYLAPLVAAFAPAEQVESVQAAAGCVVGACLAAEPPALAVACALVGALRGGLAVRWPREGLLELCMDHDQWQVAEALVDSAHNPRLHAAAGAGRPSGGTADSDTALSRHASAQITENIILYVQCN